MSMVHEGPDSVGGVQVEVEPLELMQEMITTAFELSQSFLSLAGLAFIARPPVSDENSLRTGLRE
jgi:hypothetical protein